MKMWRDAQRELTWEERYPYTVVLRAATEDDKTVLLNTLARAVLLLVQAEPENVPAQETYTALRTYLPSPPKPRAANIVQFPQRRSQ